MISRIGFGFATMVWFSAGVLVAADLDKAPPKFSYGERSAVFADFSNVQLNLVFDAATGKTTGSAVINFSVAHEGMPIFDLIPKPTRVEIDGVDVPLGNVFLLKDPDRQSTLRAVGVEVSPGQSHVLEIDYRLGDEVSYSDGSVAAGFFMSDLTDREYWEQYAPTNYEYDQYQQTLTVEVTGTDRAHELFVNGVD